MEPLTEERYRGVLLGLAVGDALGAAVGERVSVRMGWELLTRVW